MSVHTLRDLFAADIDSIDRSEPVSHAKRRMDTNESRSLLVVDGDQLVGIVKRNDLLKLDGVDQERPVGDFMDPNVPKVTEDHTVEQAHASLGGDINIEQVPVLDHDGNLIGVVNRGDLTAESTAPGGSTDDGTAAASRLPLEEGMDVKDSEGSKLGSLAQADFTASGEVEFILVEHGMIFKNQKRLPGDVVRGVEDGDLVLAISSTEFGMIKDIGEE
jgi:CBS domain-containing protein